MRRCISTWQDGQHRQALHDAEVWVNRFSCDIQASEEWAWLMPKLIANPNDALFAVKAKYDIDVESVQELVASHDYVKIRQRSVNVRRIYGWLGFFWWELYQDMLTKDFTPGVCKNCQGIIRGRHKDRENCTKVENPECARQRARIRQRKRREKLRHQS